MNHVVLMGHSIDPIMHERIVLSRLTEAVYYFRMSASCVFSTIAARCLKLEMKLRSYRRVS